MSPEEKELLKRSVALGEENNDILRGMERSMRLSRFMNTLYWLVIIAAAVGGYYFLQPYIDQVKGLYDKAQSTLTSVDSHVSNFGK